MQYNNQNKINKLEKENQNLKNRLNEVSKENINLKTELRGYKNNEIYFNNKIKELENKIKRIKNENENLNNKLNKEGNKIENKSENKDITIKLKKDLSLKENELKDINSYLIPVIFNSTKKKLQYAIICSNNDYFNYVENILYQKYPEIAGNNIFTCKGAKIMKYKTMAANGIKYGDIIIINN